MGLSSINTNLDSLSQTTCKSLVLSVDLRTLSRPPESFRTATWLKSIVPKTLDYLPTFVRRTRLKSIAFKERLTVPDHLLDYPVWIYLIFLTANWESNYSSLGVAYNY